MPRNKAFKAQNVLTPVRARWCGKTLLASDATCAVRTIPCQEYLHIGMRRVARNSLRSAGRPNILVWRRRRRAFPDGLRSQEPRRTPCASDIRRVGSAAGLARGGVRLRLRRGGTPRCGGQSLLARGGKVSVQVHPEPLPIGNSFLAVLSQKVGCKDRSRGKCLVFFN